jgi:hypothetical protein
MPSGCLTDSTTRNTLRTPFLSHIRHTAIVCNANHGTVTGAIARKSDMTLTGATAQNDVTYATLAQSPQLPS